MARLFDGTSSDNLDIDVAPVTAPPFTMCCWFRHANVTDRDGLMWLGDKDVTNHYFALRAAGNVAGDPVVFIVNDGATALATTTTGYTANTWHHAAGVAASTTDRRAFIDGGSKATNTSSKTPAGLDRISLGKFGDSSPGDRLTGRLAEAAIWNVALTDAQVAAHAAGVSAFRIRPGNLKGYWPIFGASPENDFSGQGNNLTVSGTTIADHAPVAPQFGFVGMEFGAAAAVAAFSTPMLGASMTGILGG